MMKRNIYIILISVQYLLLSASCSYFRDLVRKIKNKKHEYRNDQTHHDQYQDNINIQELMDTLLSLNQIHSGIASSLGLVYGLSQD